VREREIERETTYRGGCRRRHKDVDEDAEEEEEEEEGEEEKGNRDPHMAQRAPKRGILA
jgi:hypothetical protein